MVGIHVTPDEEGLLQRRKTPAESHREWRDRARNQPVSMNATIKTATLVRLLEPYGLTQEYANEKLAHQMHTMSTPSVMAGNIIKLGGILKKFNVPVSERAQGQKRPHVTMALHMALANHSLFGLDHERILTIAEKIGVELGRVGLHRQDYLHMGAKFPTLFNLKSETLIDRFWAIDKWRKDRGGATRDFVAGLRNFPGMWARTEATVIDRIEQNIQFYTAGFTNLAPPRFNGDVAVFMEYSGRHPQNVIVSSEYIALRALFAAGPSNAASRNFLAIPLKTLRSDLQAELGEGFAAALDHVLHGMEEQKETSTSLDIAHSYRRSQKQGSVASGNVSLAKTPPPPRRGRRPS